MAKNFAAAFDKIIRSSWAKTTLKLIYKIGQKEAMGDCFRPSHIRHEFFQVVQCSFPLQKLFVKRHGEVELHNGEIVYGETAD